MLEEIPIIEARGLRKSFGSVQVLQGIDINLRRGEILAIMGPSGSGKSTLLHCLAGIVKPDGGDVQYNGKEISTLSQNELAKLRRTDFGFIFQFGELVPELPVRENVALPLLLQGVSRRRSLVIADEWLNVVGIADLAKTLPYILSGGELQRAAIARAMAIDSKVIFADEPTGSLDSVNSEKTMRLFTELTKKHDKAVVVVTHSREIASYSDRTIYLRDGVVVSEPAGR